MDVTLDQAGKSLARRPTPRIKPIAALLALYRLMRDPQDTGQVFRLTEALRGRSTRNSFERFAATPMGQTILSEQRSLLAALSDHAGLAALPEGTLGRRYLAFMAEENLSAEGLVDLAKQNLKMPPTSDDGISLYAARMRDMHDLYHVLSGYGRDELGEICVLAFSFPQQKIRSFWVISRLGMLNIARRLRSAGISGHGVITAAREAARHGAEAAWLPAADLEAMLREDLTALRARLNIKPPASYHAVIERLTRNSGVNSFTIKDLIDLQP